MADLTFDFSETPDTMLLPDQLYDFEIKALETVEARSNKTYCQQCGTDKGKMMLKVTYEVLEPSDCKGAPLTENFVIGTDADPCAHKTQTLAGRNFGAINFVNLLDKIGVPRNQMNQALHKRFQAFVVSKVIDTNDGKMEVNNISREKYPLGTMHAGTPTPEKLYPKGIDRLPERQRSAAPAAQEPATMSCPICNEQVSMNEIDEHAAKHQA